MSREQHIRSRLNLFVQHRPKLHYTDTGYGHVVQHQQTDKLTTILQLVKMLRCAKCLSVGGDFVVQQVVELL